MVKDDPGAFRLRGTALHRLHILSISLDFRLSGFRFSFKFLYVIEVEMNDKDKTLRKIVVASEKDLHVTVIELCEQFLGHFGDDNKVLSIYSLALFSVGRLADAHIALDRDLSTRRVSDEFGPWLLCRKGHIFRESGDYESAIRWYLKAHKSEPNEATFLIFAGLLQFRLGQYDKAAKTLLKATNSKEGAIDEAFYNLGVVSFYNLGVVRMAQARFEDAQFSFEKALKIDPRYPEARNALRDVKSAIKVSIS